MSGYLLDTSVIIDYLRKKDEIIKLVDGIEEDVFSSMVCVGELYVGVFRDHNPAEAERKLSTFLSGLTEILGLTNQTMREFGKIVCELFKSGQTIGEMDALIAATCLANDLVLVTKNSKHFARIPSLKIEAINLT